MPSVRAYSDDVLRKMPFIGGSGIKSPRRIGSYFLALSAASVYVISRNSDMVRDRNIRTTTEVELDKEQEKTVKIPDKSRKEIVG